MLFSSKVSTTFVVGYQKSEEQGRIQILDLNFSKGRKKPYHRDNE